MAIDLHNKMTVSGLESLLRNILESLWSGKAAPDKQKSFVPDGGASPPSGRAPGQAEAKLF